MKASHLPRAPRGGSPIRPTRTLGLALIGALTLAMLAPWITTPGVALGSASPAASPAPPASEWLAAARSGATFPLTVDGQTFALKLRENTELFGAGLVVRDADGAPVDMSGTHPLAADVVGEPAGWGRVTVFGDAVAGVLYAPSVGQITVGPQTRGGIGMMSDAVRVHYPTHPHATYAADTLDALSAAPMTSAIVLPDTTPCLELTPHALADPMGLALGWPTRTFEISVPVDAQFVNAYPTTWASVATSFINGVDGLYARDINIRVAIVDMHSHASATFPGTTTADLLTNAISHYTSSHAAMARENVHVFTGKALSGAVGQANCIGGAGDKRVAYTVSEGTNFDPIGIAGFQLYADAYTKDAAHEMGHILSAHHHYANCVESATQVSPITRPADACTLMFNFIDLQILKFSSVNRLTTRGWADMVGL